MKVEKSQSPLNKAQTLSNLRRLRPDQHGDVNAMVPGDVLLLPDMPRNRATKGVDQEVGDSLR